MKPKLPGADCENCPLKDIGTPVPAEANGCGAAFVGERPGAREAEKGIPIAGRVGFLFSQGLRTSGMARKGLHITNAVACFSPEKLPDKAFREAANCCRPRLEQEVEHLPRVIAASGTALTAFTGLRGILKWFGHPLTDTTQMAREVFPVLPPLLALAAPAMLPVFKRIMNRAAQWVRGEFAPWHWPTIHTKPTPEALAALRRIAAADLFAYDIETAGVDPLHDKLLCVGVATTQEAVVLEWPPPPAFREALEACFQGPAIKAAHNSQHDRLGLEAAGVELRGPFFDTLLAHKAIYPQLRHGLGFVCAVEFPMDRWKSDFHDESEMKGSDMFEFADGTTLRTYCGKDCIATAMLAERERCLV